MSADQVIQLISALGFPSVCLIVLGKWIGRRIERSEDAAREREIERNKECQERERRMTVKIDSLESDIRHLEKYMRDELLGVIKDGRKVLLAQGEDSGES